VAYISYDSRLRAPSSVARSRPVPAPAKLAWGRLMTVAASVLAWIGIIAAARAIF
jgi:hypothetical protein